MVDLTLADRDGTLVLLALNWAKAFDSISPTALLSALGRFGIPATVRRFIQAIYNHRTFTVQASGCKSAVHVQHFGISQGCPLSPFLFSILMTVLFTDASPRRKDNMDVHHPASVIKEVIYADDTLLVAVKPEDAESFMHDVVVAGKVYGLSLNWDKTEVMPVGCEAQIKGPDGKHIGSRQAITYLGSVIAANGSINSELNRRLGMAKGDFDALNRVWKHANLGLKKKLDIFSACVISRLLYSLHTAWLRKAELRKIDGFQAKCLRKILGIQHAFYSHVRDETILQEADCSKLSTIIQRQQLLLLGRVACEHVSFMEGLLSHECPTVADRGVDPGKFGLQKFTNLPWTCVVTGKA